MFVKKAFFNGGWPKINFDVAFYLSCSVLTKYNTPLQYIDSGHTLLSQNNSRKELLWLYTSYPQGQLVIHKLLICVNLKVSWSYFAYTEYWNLKIKISKSFKHMSICHF